MIKDISIYVEQLVGDIDNTITGVFNADTGVTDTCLTKYARVGKYVTDTTNTPFLITGIETDSYLAAGTADGLLFLAAPYFISGTRISANREWSIAEQGDLTKKTPIVWLLSDVRYFKYGRESVYDWESDLRIFFLDETNVTDYYAKDHVENVVEPMAELANLFIKAVEKSRSFKTLETYEIINFTRFGVEETNGYIRNILDANLSGVELRIKLVKYKNNCNC